MEESRHIPKKTSDAVKDRDSFECAWCGEKFFDRHHIKEYSEGGLHHVDNLILLCPTCHRQAHNGEITKEELLSRRSTHMKGDRISGGVEFFLSEPWFRIGQLELLRVPTLLEFRGEPIIALVKSNNEYLLSTRFYSREGKLIFWMSSNRYWAPQTFTIIKRPDSLQIINSDDPNNYLKLWNDGGCINILGKNYLGGRELAFTPSEVRFHKAISLKGRLVDGLVGIGLG